MCRAAKPSRKTTRLLMLHSGRVGPPRETMAMVLNASAPPLIASWPRRPIEVEG